MVLRVSVVFDLMDNSLQTTPNEISANVVLWCSTYVNAGVQLSVGYALDLGLLWHTSDENIVHSIGITWH